MVYNGIDPFELVERAAARNTLAPKNGSSMWIGTLSELHAIKGLDLLIAGFADLSQKYVNVSLVIVGSGDEKQNLETLVSSLNLSGRVFFAGFVPDAKQYLSAFDIFTLT